MPHHVDIAKVASITLGPIVPDGFPGPNARGYLRKLTVQSPAGLFTVTLRALDPAALRVADEESQKGVRSGN